MPCSRTDSPSRSLPRGSVTPWIMRATSDASVGSVSPGSLSLRACTAPAPAPSARSHASKYPGEMTESASSIAIASHSSSRARSRPACRAAARPGWSLGPRSTTIAPWARAIPAVASVQRSATTITRSPGRRSAAIASRQRPITSSSL